MAKLLPNGFRVALIVAGLLPAAAFAQSTKKLPEFEVASIRPYITDVAKAGPGAVDAQMPNLSVNASRIVNIVNLNLRNLALTRDGGDAPTMFDAVEKLGLKFVPANHAMEFIVIDHCDKQPTEN